MGFFGLFKKKKEESELPSSLRAQSAEDWSNPGASPDFGLRDALQPLQPLEQLRPQAMEKPGSINQAEFHALLGKLDAIAAKLELINHRLANLETFIQQQLQQQPIEQRSFMTSGRPPARQW